MFSFWERPLGNLWTPVFFLPKVFNLTERSFNSLFLILLYICLQMDGSKAWDGLIEALLAFGTLFCWPRWRRSLPGMTTTRPWFSVKGRALVYHTVPARLDQGRIWLWYSGQCDGDPPIVYEWGAWMGFNLSHKYEDYCSVIPADEVLDVKYTKPSVTLGLYFVMIKMQFVEYVSYPTSFIFPVVLPLSMSSPNLCLRLVFMRYTWSQAG